MWGRAAEKMAGVCGASQTTPMFRFGATDWLVSPEPLVRRSWASWSSPQDFGAGPGHRLVGLVCNLASPLCTPRVARHTTAGRGAAIGCWLQKHAMFYCQKHPFVECHSTWTFPHIGTGRCVAARC